MRMIAVLLCGALAACSQTNTQAPKGAAQSAEKPKVQQTAATRCTEAAQKMQKQAMNAAMVGGALSMVGGLGGFGGRGGAIAGQVLSTGGSLVQAKAQDDAQGMMEEECLS